MSNTLKFGNGQWATKKGSTLAYNDENGNFKPLPFNFERSTGATRVNKQGLIEVVSNNEPRIDFLNDSKGALLLEPARTNSFQQSNQFDTTWQISAAGVSVTPNQVGVGNSQDAWKLTEGTFDGNHFIRQTPNVGGVVSISVYAKAGTNDFVYFRGVTGLANKRTWFNLSNGTVGTSEGISAEMISMGNGWYRCVMVLDHQTAFEYYIGTSNADGVSSYQGNNNYIFIQNAQLEEGSYATSYIPTNGSAVTRVAESSSQIVPDGVIGQTEGSVYVEVNISNTTFKTILALDTGSASDFIILDTSSSLSPKILVRQSSGSFPAIITGTTMSYGVNKIAFCYKSGDYAMYVNGVLSGTSTSTTFPSGIIKRISVGANSSYGYLSDTVNDVKLYNTRLSNSELQALTS